MYCYRHVTPLIDQHPSGAIEMAMAAPSLATGALVELVHEPSRLSVLALVESKGEGGGVSLCSVERPYEKLRIAQNAHVDWAVSAATKFSVFIVEYDAESNERSFVYLRALAHQKKPNRGDGTGWYLGVSTSVESPTLVGDAGKGDSSRF